MKKKISFLLFVAFTLTYSSCKTDFDISAPYKETMVIYGLLNPTDQTHYIRVSKAFLGEGNSLIMAQERDSVNYGNILNVTLQRLYNGVVVQESSMLRDTSIPKDEGVFFYPYQVTYASADSIRSDSKYRIKVTNTQTGLTASAETKIVSEFHIEHPQDHSPGVTPNFNFTLPGVYSADFRSATNGFVYSMTIRLHYKEFNLLTNDSTAKYVDWDFSDQAVGTGQSLISYSLSRPDLYRIVGNSVKTIDTTLYERKIDSAPVEFIFTAGSEDLYTYQQLIKPNIGVVQDRPLFTNVENGIGLITSRYVKSLYFNLDGISRAAFDTSSYTKHLHFH